jgi:hypothetical protein
MRSQTNCLVDSVLASAPTRASAQRQLAAMALGLAEAIQRDDLPVEEASKDLFTLDNYKALRRHRLAPSLVELFQWGLELEDVASLLSGSAALEESLRAIVTLARRVLASAGGGPRRLRGNRAGLRV